MGIEDRCRGLMVGLAAGNLLGILCEGWPREEIRIRWPNGVRDIEAQPGYPDDDDLAQAVILAAACHGTEALDADDLARRFWIWGEENGLGMGTATKETLARYGGGRPRRHGAWRNRTAQRRGSAQSEAQVAREPVGLPALQASRTAWEDSGGKAAGNGAVMRCAPLAIRWRHDDAALVRNTVCSAAVTHWDSRCIWSSVFVNLAIASLLRKPPDDTLQLVERAEHSRKTLGDTLVPFGIEAPAPTKVTKALDVSHITTPDEIGLDGRDMGYTLKALQVALWCVHRAEDFEEALIAIVNAGGDTDTNGAVAGAVLGARFGLEAIPKRWCDRVAKLRARRTPMEVWADRLTETHTSARSGQGTREMARGTGGNGSRTIQISDAVWNAIAERGKFGETEDDVLRREFNIPAKDEPGQLVSTKHGSGRRGPRRARKRMSTYVEHDRLLVQFADTEKSWDLPDPLNKRAIRRIRDEAVDYALAHGASHPGQTNAVKKALTDAGYYLTR